MDRNNIEALLDSYLKGETSQKENELVEKWLEENNNSHSEWHGLNESQKVKWLTGVFAQIQNNIQVNEPKVVSISPHRRLWRRIAVAAALVGVCLTMYLGWPVVHNHLYPVQLAELTVPANQQRQITLPDGSKVWVNSDSQITYEQGFNGKTREIYLSGEAYFDIKHDRSRPFIIHTGKVVTTVLGTAFNIKEDRINQNIVVTVTRGKVSVANGKKLLGVIIPNQQISFNLINNSSTQTNVDAEQAIAWQDTELHFNDITFAEAVLQLQQRFNVKIDFSNDRIKECRFTGTALTGDKLHEILKVICAFNHATYQIKTDGSIMIDGNGCN